LGGIGESEIGLAERLPDHSARLEWATCKKGIPVHGPTRNARVLAVTKPPLHHNTAHSATYHVIRVSDLSSLPR
jgi:hypothetical protein